VPKRTFIKGRWRRAALIGVVAVVTAAAVAVGGFLYLRSRDQATPLSTDAAVQRFRGDGASPSSPTATRSMPAEGVYVYATSGGEQVDALGGLRHDYPPETTVTIRYHGCGVLFRWDALVERWDERVTCPAEAGSQVQTFSSRHEFFGRADQRDLAFEPGNVACPAPLPGTTWTFRGSGSDTNVDGKGEVVGLPTVRVDDRPIETIRVRVTVRSEGNARGTSQRDSWLRMSDCLLVRESARTDSLADSPLGSVRYTEDYELRLQTPTPRK
jgi:hypothetical protein